MAEASIRQGNFGMTKRLAVAARRRDRVEPELALRFQSGNSDQSDGGNRLSIPAESRREGLAHFPGAVVARQIHHQADKVRKIQP